MYTIFLENYKNLIVGHSFNPSPKNVKEVQKLTGRMAALSRFISRLSDKSHAFFGILQNPKEIQWMEVCASALHELKAYLTTPLLTKPLLGEVLLLFLAVSEHAVSAILIRDEGSKYLQIYYVSMALLDAETRYSHLQKLALALIVATRKLHPYFQAHPIVVVTFVTPPNCPRHMVDQPANNQTRT